MKYMKQSFLLTLLVFSLFSPAFIGAQATFTGGSPRTAFVNAAKSYLGTPYVSGGSSLRGMDCSGLVFRAAIDGPSRSVPRTVQALSDFAIHIPDQSMEPGDILFFNTIGRLSHVGIYLGNGKFIHAASAGPKTGVIISSLSENYWKRAYLFAGSILGSEPQTSWPHPDNVENSNDELKPPIHPFQGDIGLRLNVTGGILWDFMPKEYPIRGGLAFAEITWAKNTSVYPGIGAGLSFDQRTESISIPFIASIAVPSGFRFFIGSQFHIKADSTLDKKIQFPGLIGLSWTSKPAVLFDQNFHFYQSAEYSWFPNETFGLGFRFNTGMTLSFDF